MKILQQICGIIYLINIIYNSKQVRRDYLDKLETFINRTYGSVPTGFNKNFLVEDKCKEDYKYPNCGDNHGVVINTTNHTDDSWIEHCICKKCGKHIDNGMEYNS